MDPLTHTLAGAALGSTRLGAKTRLALPALVIGANLPDIDAVLYLVDGDLALEFRRGWTHGVAALLVLPLVQTMLLLLYARARPSEETTTDPRWLLALSTIGVWSHPALDWLNTYGMRWLMPFRPTWFYGDSVFIMDPWLWLILGIGYLAGRRPSIPLIAAWLFFTLAVARQVMRRSPEYLIVVAIVSLILLLVLLWKHPVRSVATGRRFAAGGVAIAVIYIAARLALHEATERKGSAALAAHGIAPVTALMAGPDPINPLQWNLVARTSHEYRFATFHWLSGFALRPERVAVPAETPLWRAAKRHPELRGFMTWTRFPAYEVEEGSTPLRLRVFDVRRGPNAGGRTVQVGM